MPASTASLFKARPRRPWRSIAWIGGALVTGFTTYAAYDLDQSYRAAVAETGRELDAQARVIAEQTTRSMQSVDLVLRHLTTSHRRLASASHSRSNMHAYLQDQAIGMVQVESLAIFDANGVLVANSMLADPPPLHIDVVNDPAFSSLHQVRGPQLSIAAARPALFKPQAWVFPIARRLETPGGAFGGIVYAGGRVEYFEQFYRDLRLGEGTAVTLMHRDGTLLARHPSAPTSLGQRYPAIDGLLTAGPGSAAGPHRAVSPIDGVDRFAVVEITPDYPLAVIVTRDATVALAAWREQAIGTMTHTVVLGLLSVLLLVLVTRQFARLDQTRESLEHSRERFALAAAGSDEGIWDWDVGRDHIYASARARAIFGLPPGPDVQPREEWFASVSMHPDDVGIRRAALQAHLAGESPVYAGEYRVRHPDGEFRWIRVRGLCVRDAQGTPVRMAGSVTDIDARKRAEEALRLSEQRFSLAVAGSSDGIVDWDIVNDRMFTSQRTMEMLGIDSRQTERTRAEWTALLRLHPDDRQRHADELCEFLASDTVLREGEYRLQRNDGEYAWIRVRNLCVRDAQGRPLRLAGSVSDIDAYKRVEAALRKSDERYALAVAGSDDGVWDWDLAAGVAFESARARELQGLPPGPRRCRSPSWWTRCASIRRTRRCAQKASAPTWPARRRPTNVSTGYGTTTSAIAGFACAPCAFAMAMGKPCRMAGSVSDIDARKRAEEALAALGGALPARGRRLQ